jgi:hypothetical protein
VPQEPSRDGLRFPGAGVPVPVDTGGETAVLVDVIMVERVAGWLAAGGEGTEEAGSVAGAVLLAAGAEGPGATETTGALLSPPPPPPIPLTAAQVPEKFGLSLLSFLVTSSSGPGFGKTTSLLSSTVQPLFRLATKRSGLCLKATAGAARF